MSIEVKVYTDGSARGNPGPGGYGAILKSATKVKELSAGYRKTTNNRMELLAVIASLEAMKMQGLRITVYTDSKYVCEAVEKKWLDSWVLKGFKGKKNSDLWMRYLQAARNHYIKFVWIKGHAGHPENERCDQLATQAADNLQAQLIDNGFESGLYN
jgi:ribonuclease HI